MRAIASAGSARRAPRVTRSSVADLLPIILLSIAAVARPARLPVLVVIAVGLSLSARADRRRVPAWAAALPVAVSFAWGLLPLPPAATDGSSCTDPLAPFAIWRIGEAVAAIGALAVLVPMVGSGVGELGLRSPGRPVGLVALSAAIVAGPVGLMVGPALAAPFFGDVRLELAGPGLLVPAVVFALSNGVMEELLYRGGLLAWTTRVTGPGVALVGQAVVFGLAHGAGPDVRGSPLVLALGMGAAGLAAGWITRRTHSLALPIAVHVGLDVPLYIGNACRIG